VNSDASEQEQELIEDWVLELKDIHNNLDDLHHRFYQMVAPAIATLQKKENQGSCRKAEEVLRKIGILSNKMLEIVVKDKRELDTLINSD
jgi:hypothetical protein